MLHYEAISGREVALQNSLMTYQSGGVRSYSHLLNENILPSHEFRQLCCGPFGKSDPNLHAAKVVNWLVFKLFSWDYHCVSALLPCSEGKSEESLCHLHIRQSASSSFIEPSSRPSPRGKGHHRIADGRRLSVCQRGAGNRKTQRNQPSG